MADQETGKDAGSCATTIADVEEVDEMTMLIRAKIVELQDRKISNIILATMGPEVEWKNF